MDNFSCFHLRRSEWFLCKRKKDAELPSEYPGPQGTELHAECLSEFHCSSISREPWVEDTFLEWRDGMLWDPQSQLWRCYDSRELLTLEDHVRPHYSLRQSWQKSTLSSYVQWKPSAGIHFEITHLGRKLVLEVYLLILFTGLKSQWTSSSCLLIPHTEFCCNSFCSCIDLLSEHLITTVLASLSGKLLISVLWGLLVEFWLVPLFGTYPISSFPLMLRVGFCTLEETTSPPRLDWGLG